MARLVCGPVLSSHKDSSLSTSFGLLVGTPQEQVGTGMGSSRSVRKGWAYGQSVFYTWVSAEHDVPQSSSPVPSSFLPPWCAHPAPAPLTPASLAWGRGRTCVCLCTDWATLSQPSATTPWSVGKEQGAAHCRPAPLVLHQNWSQAAGTGPSGSTAAGQHPISRDSFFSSSCVTCRQTGPGEGPQPPAHSQPCSPGWFDPRHSLGLAWARKGSQ